MAQEKEVVKPEEELYLCYKENPQQCVATVNGAVRYWYPTVGKAKVKLTLSFRGPELLESESVKIRTTEKNVGDKDTLGAFADARECYYFTDTQGDKQLWQINAVSGRPDRKIRYGDQVHITNRSYTDPLRPEGKWLTTGEDPEGYWVFEKA